MTAEKYEEGVSIFRRECVCVREREREREKMMIKMGEENE